MRYNLTWWWWERRRARKEAKRLRERQMAEAIAEQIAVRRPIGRVRWEDHDRERAPRLRPVVKPIQRRWDDDPSLPSTEVSWMPVEPPTVIYDPPAADPSPSSIDPGGGSSTCGQSAGSRTTTSCLRLSGSASHRSIRCCCAASGAQTCG